MSFTPEEWRLAAVEWARLDGVARELEETRKVVLNEIRQQSDAPTEAGKETAAYADSRYRQHITTMVSARTLANVQRAKVDGMRMAFEMWRTKESTKRAEMRIQ
jgi:hypothetical protein